MINFIVRSIDFSILFNRSFRKKQENFSKNNLKTSAIIDYFFIKTTYQVTEINCPVNQNAHISNTSPKRFFNNSSVIVST